MRHKRAGLHLSRTSAHRKALFSNMVAALLTYERIRTTLVKAKEIRRLAERTITWARRLGAVLTKKPEKRLALASSCVTAATPGS
jgi:ribosomal protein L17